MLLDENEGVVMVKILSHLDAIEKGKKATAVRDRNLVVARRVNPF